MLAPYSIYYSREFRIHLYYLRHDAISLLIDNGIEQKRFKKFFYLTVIIFIVNFVSR